MIISWVMDNQQFWELAFCAAVAGLHSADEAALIADEALKARAERWKEGENSRHMIVSALVEIIEEFIRHSAKLAEMAGTQWADDNDLSQPCHWLNETSKEAKAMISILKRNPLSTAGKSSEREQLRDAVEAGA